MTYVKIGKNPTKFKVSLRIFKTFTQTRLIMRKLLYLTIITICCPKIIAEVLNVASLRGGDHIRMMLMLNYRGCLNAAILYNLMRTFCREMGQTCFQLQCAKSEIISVWCQTHCVLSQGIRFHKKGKNGTCLNCSCDLVHFASAGVRWRWRLNVSICCQCSEQKSVNFCVNPITHCLVRLLLSNSQSAQSMSRTMK